MDHIVTPLRVDLLDGTGHLRSPVTAVLVRITVLIILVDPAEVSAIVLSIISQFADFEVRIRDKPFHRLRMEDNRGGILRIFISGVDNELVVAVDRRARRNIRGDFNQSTFFAIVEAFRERTAVEHITSIALLGKEHVAVGSKQVVHAIAPADVLTDVLVDLDQLLNGAALCEHVEDGASVIGDRIAVITSVVRVEGVVDLTQDASRKNARRGREAADGGQTSSIKGDASGRGVKARLDGELGGVGQIVVVVTLDPLDVDVVGQDLDVVVHIVHGERGGADIFQADPVGFDGQVAQTEVLLVKRIADLADVGQTGVVLTASASDADVFPPVGSRGHGALGDSIFDDRSHVVGESRLGNETKVGIFIETQPVGAEGNTSSFALKLIGNRLACSSNRC